MELFTKIEKFVKKPMSPTLTSEFTENRMEERDNELQIIQRIKTSKQTKRKAENPVKSNYNLRKKKLEFE